MAKYRKTVALGLAEHANLAYFHKAALERLFRDEDFVFVEGCGERVDTQAFVVTDPEGVIVAFRGTQQAKDVATNLWAAKTTEHPSSPSLRVHEGFCTAYVEVSEQITTEIERRKAESTDVFVTGHSLGGALATLAALDIKLKHSELNVAMYNFGSPRVGYREFAEFYDCIVEDSHRVVVPRDAVPHLPVAGWLPGGYRHIGRERKLKNVSLPFLDHDLVQSYMPQLSWASDGQSFFDQED